MKFVDEYRDGAAMRTMAQRIAATVTRGWRLMEVCGGQTHSIVRHGLDQLLPPAVELIHGPGCPVCVTPAAAIDQAVALAHRPDTLLCAFGDMLRVPGTAGSLAQARAAGGRVQMVYSPLDAVRLAQAQPALQVVFFAVGFETTAPANALAVLQARALGLRNFSLLVSQVRVPPAIRAIAGSADCRVDGFLAAGHVCTVMGADEYQVLAREIRRPIVITGFEPLDILHGVWLCLQQLEQARAEVQNPYARAVRTNGNVQAQALLDAVFEIVPQQWRGIGELPDSGLALRAAYRDFDARLRLDAPAAAGAEDPRCIAGQVLRGLRKPDQCPAFGRQCTPEHPLGAPMVSGEGACAAYYRYARPAAVAP